MQDVRSDSGMELVRLGEELEVIVLRVGLPVNGRPYAYSPVERRRERSSHDVCLAYSHSYAEEYMFLMRDEKEERKKQARSYKQQGKATQHTQGSHFFLRKMSCLGWDSNPRHSTL